MCDGAAGEIKNPATSIAPVGMIMSAIGSMVSAGTARQVGKAQRAESRYSADQMDLAASNVIGAGQRLSENERLKANILASRAIAVAAASGGDVSSPGVTKVISDIAGQGAYNAGVALYDAEDKARQLRMAGEGARYTGDVMEAAGKSKASAYLFNSAANLAGSASLFSKYGRGGPKKEPNVLNDWQEGGATGNM